MKHRINEANMCVRVGRVRCGRTNVTDLSIQLNRLVSYEKRKCRKHP